MEYGLVFLVALGAYWFFSNQKAQRLARALELETWELDASDPPYVYRFVVMDGPGSDQESEYMLRRKKDGGWERKATDATWRDDVARAEKDAREGMPLGQSHLKELVERGNGWEQLSDEMAPSLETAYERYVRSA